MSSKWRRYEVLLPRQFNDGRDACPIVRNALVVGLVIYITGATGCGDYPPIVETKHDITSLPVTEDSIRARGLDDADIPSLAHLRDLVILDFYGGWKAKDAKITDDGLANLAALKLRHLDTLTLGHNPNITDAGLAHLEAMHTVTYLGLCDCPKITDEGLSHLVRMKNLTGLDLSGCPGITDRGFNELARKRDWDRIYFDGCPNVSAAAVAKLQAAQPHAVIKKDDHAWELRNE